MASLNIDENEQLLSGYDVVEWIDDVAQYQCTRCHKVLVQHYISNCQHKFCSNCKRILDDGSHRWKCPECKEFIEDMGRQDFEFQSRVNNLRLHCPNRKYGCEHVCPFKDLKEHLDRCEHTRERALPVQYEGVLTTEMLEQMFTTQMLEVRREMREMKQTIEELKDKCNEKGSSKEEESVREGSWELSVEVERMRREMLEMDKKQKNRKLKLKTDLFLINNRVDGVKSDVIVETTRLNNDIQQLKKSEAMRKDSESVSLTVEENKAKILKLEGKADAYNEMIDFSNRKNNEQTQLLKNDLEKELKTIEMKVHNINADAEKLDNRVVSNEKKHSEEITKLSETIRSKCIGQVEKCLLVIEKVSEKTIKMRNTSEKSKTEVEQMIREIQNNFKEHSEKVVKIEESTQSTIGSIDQKLKTMEENVSHLNTEVEEMKNKIENIGAPQFLLSTPKTKIENDAIPLPIPVSNIPQMTCFDLTLLNHSFEPAVTWVANKVYENFQMLNKFGYHWISKSFTWTGYPVEAVAEITRPNGMDYLLRLDPKAPLNQLKVIPSAYYVLKDQKGNVKHKSRSKRFLFAEALSRYIDFTDDLSTGVSLKRNLTKDLRDTLYNVDSSVVIEIYIEPPAMLNRVYSYDGKLNWFIDKYKKRKQLAEEELVLYHQSPYFYTEAKGYRVQVLMFLDGYVNNEHGLIAKIMFLRGEFDEDLPNTFTHSATVTLLDQNNPNGNVSVTEEWNLRRGAEYSILLGSDRDIKPFVENDTLYYNVTIE